MILMMKGREQQIMRYWARVYIQDKPVTMLVDTGSPISIIPEETAEQIFDPKWDKWEKEASNIFRDFNGKPVQQVGVLQTDIELNSWKVQKARLLITPRDQNKTPLLGADLIRRLGPTHKSSRGPETAKTGQTNIWNINTYLKSQMQAEFKNLFQSTGKIKNHIVKTKFKKPLQPTLQKGRRLPLAFQEKCWSRRNQTTNKRRAHN